MKQDTASKTAAKIEMIQLCLESFEKVEVMASSLAISKIEIRLIDNVKRTRAELG